MNVIKVLRVDDRLLHGQVAAAWIGYYQVDTIIIGNDEMINDRTMQVAFKLATPPGVTLSMKSLQGAINVINNPKHASRTIMVITKNLKDAQFVIEGTGHAISDVLLGGLRSGEGKVQINMNSYMSEEDVSIMNQLEKCGCHIIMQADPTSKKISTDEIRKHFK